MVQQVKADFVRKLTALVAKRREILKAMGESKHKR